MAKILNIYGKELWSDDRPSMRASLVAAVLAGADLARADLAGADLARAYLAGTDLTGAYLPGTDLTGAYLADANLALADLTSANLTGTYLAGANLTGTNLADANLTGTNLAGARGINPHRCTPLLMLRDQPGPIRAYKLVNEDGEGPINGGLKYIVGASVEVSDANTDPSQQCAAGVNVATLDWCMREWRADYRILVVEFTAADIAAIPTATDGKFRLHRCTVVGEKDLSEIGLVRPRKQNKEWQALKKGWGAGGRIASPGAP